MPARLARHVLAAGAASCALALATAAPGVARPAGDPPPQRTHDVRAGDPAIATSSLAGTTEAHPAPQSTEPVAIATPDDGATTLAVLLIAGGALAAGAGAGFAGGRRVAVRPR
jgi:hypothetical protein